MQIVPVYAALLAVLFVVLSFRTIRLRQRLSVALGDAGNGELLRASRVHANFAEYVPLALLLFFFVESAGAAAWLVHALCALLLLGRLSHAYGVSQVREQLAFRVSGMVLTFSTLMIAAGYLLLARL